MLCTPEEIEALSKDSSYHDLGTLPSLGIPYNNRELKFYIRTFRLPELKMLSKAVELNEMEHLLRAVDNVISFPVKTLTIGDFFYVLLWLRLYSMPKSPYVIEWHCNQPFFVHKETRQYLTYQDENWPTVEQLRTQYENSPCDTENTSIIHQADVEILTLDDNIVLPIGFDFPRMSIYQDRAAALKDPEMAMLAPAIQWLAGDTWEQKLAYADANPDAIGEALDLNRKVVHGIAEQVTFECRRCRMEHTTKLELNALNFFR
jgi:hypothetical protein